MRAVFLNGPRVGDSVNMQDSVETISVPVMIETCTHHLEKYGSFVSLTTVNYEKQNSDGVFTYFKTDNSFAEAYFCQQCYSEAKANLEAENLKASIRKEVIYELQTFLKEFE